VVSTFDALAACAFPHCVALLIQTDSLLKVEIAFKKQGQAATRIQRETGDDKWTNAGEATTSPFVDETPSASGKPKKRRYRAVYPAKNQPAGQYSDIVMVVTTP
jgi:hypothetical protein